MELTETQWREYFPREPWDHQMRGVMGAFSQLKHHDTTCVAAVTGAGKTVMQAAMLRAMQELRKRCIVYNARRPLTNQVSRTLDDAGVYHGARAASMKNELDLNARIQVASLQTDFQRVLNQGRWEIHDCDYVIVDEAHFPEAKSNKAQELLQRYLASGAKIIGFTGTPLEINHIYKSLVVAGTNSEMRACGAHVPVKTYCIHEMDTSRIRPTKTGEFREGDITKEVWSPSIVGYAYEDWKKVNPEGRVTMASCPGVDESIWTAKQWLEKGHKVAHVDANECWVNGERYQNDAAGTVREQVLKDARDGEFDLITNCEVLSTGIDIPCLGHLIMLRPFGSLSNYLQCGGRVIRKSEQTPDFVTVTDHVGNARRHGSLNEDRDWEYLFDKTEAAILKERQQKKQEEKEPEPITCVNCGQMRLTGPRCPACGHMSDRRERRIVQQDGTLTRLEGEDAKEYKKPAKPKVRSKEQKEWDALYFAARNPKAKRARYWTFLSALKMYQSNMGEMPPMTLNNLPTRPELWNEKIVDVPRSELTWNDT